MGADQCLDTDNSVCHILRCYPRPLRIVEDHQVVVQTLPVSGKHRQPVTSLTPLSPHSQSYKSNLYLDPFRPTQARSSWRRQDCKWGQAWIWLTLLLVVSCDSDAGYSGFCTHPLIASNYGIQTNVIKHSLPSLSPDDKKCFHVVKNICRQDILENLCSTNYRGRDFTTYCVDWKSIINF